MKYDYEPLLDPSSEYQIKLQEYDRFRTNLRERVNVALNKGIDASEKELLLVDSFETDFNSKSEELNDTFIKDYKKLVELKKYFFGCPHDIYVSTYPSRLNDFTTKLPEAKEIDFLSLELEKGILVSIYEVFGDIERQIYYSLKNRLDFLQTKANELGFELKVKDKTCNKYSLKRIKHKNKKSKSQKQPLMDFSDSKGTEKIVMLQQLGVLDFLKTQQPFIHSTNKLAEAISGFIGEKPETVQSYINPIINPTTSQRNNPMTKKKVVLKVNQKLVSIGFNIPK